MMTNLNNRETYNREPYREVDRDANGHITHTKEVVSPTMKSAVPNPQATSYRNGYFQGRLSEQRLSEENARIRETDGAARGLMIGILLTALTGLVVGATFLISQRNQTPTPASSPVTVPAPASNNQPSQNRTTVIERTTELVPVPQEPVVVPDVNVTVPSSSQPAPASQSAPSQPAPTIQMAPPSQPGTTGTTGTGTAPAPASSSPNNSTSGSTGN
jgi:cell division protein FtsN